MTEDAGLPPGPSGTLARVLVFAIGSVFVVVGLALGWLLLTRGIDSALTEARLVIGLGIGSAVMLLFGALFVSLGLGTGLRV
ncbi:hypothetical protein [Halalkalicoccus subterraneus]|uniref:hypothetical protein n=1 Tax=Halalkalicoccus subterraneus TaxID=2675002 RepID=UPI000EFBF4C5|nr:hypothetical protein [Halalkalicoccus subterraneus]